MTRSPIPSREIPIINQRGLHARASAKFVQTAERLRRGGACRKDGVKVGGTSIMGLMMLAASPGYSIRVSASGNQAEQALDALEQLIQNKLRRGDADPLRLGI
jgi:phosphocarrier protein HPr